jgi:hypothetical protein
VEVGDDPLCVVSTVAALNVVHEAGTDLARAIKGDGDFRRVPAGWLETCVFGVRGARGTFKVGGADYAGGD